MYKNRSCCTDDDDDDDDVLLLDGFLTRSLQDFDMFFFFSLFFVVIGEYFGEVYVTSLL